MKIDTANWKEFVINRLFDIHTGGDLIMSELEAGTIPVASNSCENNNVAFYTTKINGRNLFNHKTSISIADRGCFYAFIQPHDFYIATRVKALVVKSTISITFKQLCFIATIINQESFKYSYGRNCCANLPHIKIKLPIMCNEDNTPVIDENRTYSDEGYIPDWQFMEDYIKSLHHKPITTKVKSDNVKDLDIDNWEEFKVSDLFNVKYGINMELNTCIETTSDDPEGIAFVARTAENNGVSAYVKRIEGKEPQPAETITVAGGGSVLSTFVQKRPFYSGRDLYLLIAKEDINLKVKMFISTVLFANQYRYSYGRQANKTLPDLILKLPIKRDSNGNPVIDDNRTYSDNGYIPDWQFMEDYINSLPYSDRI